MRDLQKAITTHNRKKYQQAISKLSKIPSIKNTIESLQDRKDKIFGC
jgi:hypothetical protein